MTVAKPKSGIITIAPFPFYRNVCLNIIFQFIIFTHFWDIEDTEKYHFKPTSKQKEKRLHDLTDDFRLEFIQQFEQEKCDYQQYLDAHESQNPLPIVCLQEIYSCPPKYQFLHQLSYYLCEVSGFPSQPAEASFLLEFKT